MKSKYDSSRHVLVEQSEIEEPQRPYEPKYIGAADTLVSDIYHWECNLKIYNEHIASLRTIPCSPDFKGVHDQIYEEGKDYELEAPKNRIDFIAGKYIARPISKPEPIPSDKTEDSLGPLIDLYTIIGACETVGWSGADPHNTLDQVKKYATKILSELKDYSLTRKQEGKHPILTEPVNYLLSNALRYCTPEQLIQLRDKLIRRTLAEGNEAVEFAEWLRTFFPDLSVENGQWCIESQVSSEQLFKLFKEEQLKQK